MTFNTVNDAVQPVITLSDPEVARARRLRGPEHEIGWLDEMAAFQSLDEVFTMFSMGLRVGAHPRCMISTTPPAEINQGIGSARWPRRAGCGGRDL
jgi:phage terminase large subunit-like protein